MKKIILINIIALCSLLVGCNNVLDFSYEDAKNHSWLFPFIKGTVVIDGKHDINNELVKMYLKVNNDSLYFNKCDSVANSEEWNSGYSNKKRRVYIKNIPYQGGDDNIVVLIVSIYEPNRIKIKIVN
jgi:hypothetical protein